MGRPRKDATTQDVRERVIVAMADRLIRFKSGRVESETVQQNPVPIETIEW